MSRRDSYSGEQSPLARPTSADEELRTPRGMVRGDPAAASRGAWTTDGAATAKSGEPTPLGRVAVGRSDVDATSCWRVVRVAARVVDGPPVSLCGSDSVCVWS